MSTKTNILHQCPTQHSPSISRHSVHTLIHTYIHTCCLYISHILFRMLCCIMFYSSLFNQQYFKQQIYSAHRYTCTFLKLFDFSLFLCGHLHTFRLCSDLYLFTLSIDIFTLTAILCLNPSCCYFLLFYSPCHVI